MLPWVIAHPGTTVSEVCSRFGYTRRELLADLELVFVCGLPGYGPGDLMVAYVEDDEVYVDLADYFAAPLRLTTQEGLALLAAGMALTSTGQAPPSLEKAVEKLARVLVPADEELMAIDLAVEPDMVDLLRRAARETHPVRIVYTSLGSDETTQRVIEPWAVFSSLGNWYVSAYCRSARGERIFRVDRIQTAIVTEENFEQPDEIPRPEVRYTPSEEDVRAVIRLSNEARWVAAYYPVEVLSDSDDHMDVGFSTGDPLVAARLLLRLGKSGLLVEGDEVRRELEELRAKIIRRYEAS